MQKILSSQAFADLTTFLDMVSRYRFNSSCHGFVPRQTEDFIWTMVLLQSPRSKIGGSLGSYNTRWYLQFDLDFLYADFETLPASSTFILKQVLRRSIHHVLWKFLILWVPLQRPVQVWVAAFNSSDCQQDNCEAAVLHCSCTDISAVECERVQLPSLDR